MARPISDMVNVSLQANKIEATDFIDDNIIQETTELDDYNDKIRQLISKISFDEYGNIFIRDHINIIGNVNIEGNITNPGELNDVSPATNDESIGMYILYTEEQQSSVLTYWKIRCNGFSVEYDCQRKLDIKNIQIIVPAKYTISGEDEQIAVIPDEYIDGTSTDGIYHKDYDESVVQTTDVTIASTTLMLNTFYMIFKCEVNGEEKTYSMQFEMDISKNK